MTASGKKPLLVALYVLALACMSAALCVSGCDSANVAIRHDRRRDDCAAELELRRALKDAEAKVAELQSEKAVILKELADLTDAYNEVAREREPERPRPPAFTEYATDHEYLLRKRTPHPRDPNLFLTVLDIDVGKQLCALRIESQSDRVLVEEGTVRVGEFVAFAPNMIGRRGIVLSSVTKESATFSLAWGGVEQQERGGAETD